MFCSGILKLPTAGLILPFSRPNQDPKLEHALRFALRLKTLQAGNMLFSLNSKRLQEEKHAFFLWTQRN
jgi:hypothetical protein